MKIGQDIVTMELPQLIVGLDSTGNDANYIHIADAKEGIPYYCPCCKGIIKPRAFKKDKEYMVQPHFYHESEGCSEESFVHYICKTWLFEKGCKFKVGDVVYTVLNTETEKTLQTKFGDYRPDIIVYTEEKKIFFFEIKYSNKKTALYAPKWDELAIDVVEVDVREFINNRHDEKIPEFKLIYSDGECFIKTYSRTDYENAIARRKIEWKRQDKLNYKIKWERLDWFWKKLQEYKTDTSNEKKVLETFLDMDYEDQVWCYLNIKGKSCLPFKDSFKEIINSSFIDELRKNSSKFLIDQDINISIRHTSPLIYTITFRVDIPYLDYECGESVSKRLQTTKGILLSENSICELKEELQRLKDEVDNANRYLEKLNIMSKLPYINRITPCSHYAAKKYDFSTLHFTIFYEDNIHNSYVKENIGKHTFLLNQITEEVVESEYYRFKKDALNELYNMFTLFALKNNTAYISSINSLKGLCRSNDLLDIRISDDHRRIWLMYGYTEVLSYEFRKIDKFDDIGLKVLELFSSKINELLLIDATIIHYIQLINSCKNGIWKLIRQAGNYLVLTFLNYSEEIKVDILTPQSEFDSYLKNKIYLSMKSLTGGIYHELRIMEER